MHTRSAAKRANANARYVAKRAANPKSNATKWVRKEGPFSPISARVFALHKTTYPVDPERCEEGSWSLCAELMNRLIAKGDHA